MKKPELLAPAGSLNKLKVAVDYGADAVYVGGKEFSLRAYADNFTIEDLRSGVEYAHSRGKKVYVTVNIFPKNADFPKAEEYFKELQDVGVDACLITDAGLIALCRRVAPDLEVHLSTQANTLNKYTVEFWARNGVSRVVLARELSVAEIKEIREYNKDTELEVFVHGAMCISYSGRCLLSNYLDGRDANRGECVQACRWKYDLREAGRTDSLPLTIEEDDRGAYILNSKDLNAIRYIDKLVDAGVDSFKIEGRMKSEYYLATVVNAYRRAIDALMEGEYDKDCEDALCAELDKVVHRDYTTAYMLGDNANTVSYRSGQNQGTYEFIGVVDDVKNGVARVEMRNRFRTGDVLEVLSPGVAFMSEFTVRDVVDENGTEIDDVKIVQQKVTIPVPYGTQKGDILRRKR